MLLDSPRLSRADIAHWDRLSVYDQMLAAATDLDTLSERSIDVIARFAAAGPACVSTSWGKDSTVLVDLVGRSGVTLPVVWMRVHGHDLPECEDVRDRMLAQHPHLEYHELLMPPQPARWWDDEAATQSKARADLGWRMIAQRFTPRHITGIRAEESRIRRIVQARWGDASDGAARPIGAWDATDVFAYLHARNLPVHPAYAMSKGGHYDRRWLRVHSLGGVTGADRGRADWEQAYYGDVIAAARTLPRTGDPQWIS